MRLQTILADHAIGPIHIVADGGVLLALEFGDIEHRLMPMLRARFGADLPLDAGGMMDELAETIARYFAGDIHAVDRISVDGGGTVFQTDIWQQLRTIPPGETRSYGEMARLIGRPDAPRAVGSANALNPISLVVPCHRLVGANGSLTGYGGGLARKRWLLDHERHWAGVAHSVE